MTSNLKWLPDQNGYVLKSECGKYIITQAIDGGWRLGIVGSDGVEWHQWVELEATIAHANFFNDTLNWNSVEGWRAHSGSHNYMIVNNADVWDVMSQLRYTDNDEWFVIFSTNSLHSAKNKMREKISNDG